MTSHARAPGGALFWTLAFLVWLGFAMVAVGGGIFRAIWLDQRLGTFAANMVETLGLVAFLGVTMWVAVPWLVHDRGKPVLKRLGVYWLSLTVAFEFLFGHFVDGASWSVLFSNYDITAGRLWILVPLTMGFGPVLVGWIQGMKVSPPLLDHH